MVQNLPPFCDCIMCAHSVVVFSIHHVHTGVENVMSTFSHTKKPPKSNLINCYCSAGLHQSEGHICKIVWFESNVSFLCVAVIKKYRQGLLSLPHFECTVQWNPLNLTVPWNPDERAQNPKQWEPYHCLVRQLEFPAGNNKVLIVFFFWKCACCIFLYFFFIKSRSWWSQSFCLKVILVDITIHF